MIEQITNASTIPLKGYSLGDVVLGDVIIGSVVENTPTLYFPLTDDEIKQRVFYHPKSIVRIHKEVHTDLVSLHWFVCGTFTHTHKRSDTDLDSLQWFIRSAF